MATFSGQGAKLVGNDGTVFAAVLGTEVTGDGAVPLPVGKFIITAVDAATDWPSNSAAPGAVDIEVGYMLEWKTGDTVITPAVGDKYVPLTLTELCDISAWTLDFSAAEILVTTFCNGQDRYEIGKTNVSGSVAGIVTVGITDDPVNGIALRFMDIVRQNGGDTIDLHTAIVNELYVELVANNDSLKADVIEYFAPVNLFGFSLSAQVGGEAQTFESPLRLSTAVIGAADVDVKPALYRFSRGA